MSEAPKIGRIYHRPVEWQGRQFATYFGHEEEKFFDMMEGHELHLLGVVVESDLSIVDGFDDLVSGNIDEMVSVWKDALDMTGGVA